MPKTCKVMKEKLGFTDIHEMKYEDIRDAMLQDENMLKNKNVGLTIHTNTLESERLRLKKQLRHIAAQMGESGIIFLGPLAYQIIKMTEFSSGLRGGSI